MSTPVVVSRIQNRRGTQAQFESLYPDEYLSDSTSTSSGLVVTVNSTTGLYVNARPVVMSGTGQFAPGTKIVSVDSGTEFTVDIAPITPLSGAVVQVPKYAGIGGCPESQYPGILLSGELALCTDTRRVFLGNVNGEYIELSPPFTGGIALTPLVIILPPSPTYTVIPELTIDTTPFFTFLYDITDSVSPDWNNVSGSNFSKNGEIKLTATQDFAPVPNLPFPPITSVNILDTGTEVKNPAVYTIEDISFKAEYNGPFIEISYMHDFPGPLMFSSSTIRWLPF
jgi:hypothetical protein